MYISICCHVVRISCTSAEEKVDNEMDVQKALIDGKNKYKPFKMDLNSKHLRNAIRYC